MRPGNPHLLLLALFAVVAGCRRDDASVPRDSGAATAAADLRTAAGDSVATAPWIAAADSALRRSLARSVMDGDTTPPAAPDFHDCDDEGSDNLPMLITAVSAEPVGHATPERGSGELGAPLASVRYRVAVRSVARFTPASGDSSIHVEMRAPTDSTQWYVAIVSPRVDTMTIDVTDYGDEAGRPRWAVCGPFGRVPDAESPFFGFFPRPAAWVRVVRWTPADASWQRIRALGDSLRRAAGPR